MYKKAAIPLLLAAAILATPLTEARAQAPYYYYYNPYYGNPILWPFLVAGAVLGTAALIATLPIRVVCSNCLPPPEGFYPFYTAYTTPPAPPARVGPAMSYQPAR
jgi:hypothetical protein